jgi:hypothetical protein
MQETSGSENDISTRLELIAKLAHVLRRRVRDGVMRIVHRPAT